MTMRYIKLNLNNGLFLYGMAAVLLFVTIVIGCYE